MTHWCGWIDGFMSPLGICEEKWHNDGVVERECGEDYFNSSINEIISLNIGLTFVWR